jgi:hypothetical protein
MRGADSQGKPYLKTLFETHEKLFGQTCSSCPSRINEYITRIKKLKFKQVENKKFKLKKGAIIVVPGTSESYSEHNLTDEISLKLLKDNPNRRSLFVKVPEDLDSLLSEEPLVDVFGKSMTIPETLSLLEEAGINTKATTADGLSKRIKSLKPDEVEYLNIVIKDRETVTE